MSTGREGAVHVDSFGEGTVNEAGAMAPKSVKVLRVKRFPDADREHGAADGGRLAGGQVTQRVAQKSRPRRRGHADDGRVSTWRSGAGAGPHVDAADATQRAVVGMRLLQAQPVHGSEAIERDAERRANGSNGPPVPSLARIVVRADVSDRRPRAVLRKCGETATIGGTKAALNNSKQARTMLRGTGVVSGTRTAGSGKARATGGAHVGDHASAS
eukprot:CAMPEP_0174835862 /NCGR_PEP_ID=MMETSP1114-20130205/5659_1 /TAXON_ID=312471 /ORGANISM="Neobodo designis, Strain CCAP 1951/1" /LENGTH=214 /DNA_ID=CAMNT_0016069819 /DNA_START=71 /DNA_END=712 /DNA_ORIENTATION=-